MVSFYLVTGFLGSGKTTFLKNILSDYSDSNRIAIIQNEFASSGTDGIELKMTGHDFRLVEVNNGSVFCVCKMGSFIQSLEKLINEYKPEIVILESSGLSDPVNIIELLRREEIKDNIRLGNIFSIADATNFEKYIDTLPRFKHQIMIADSIILNKLDIFHKEISRITEKIKNINPFAEIIETSYCKTDLKRFFNFDKNHPGSTHEAASAFSGKESGGRPDINACVLRVHDKMEMQNLQLFIKELQKSSPRIKGYINLANNKVMAVQTVYENFEIKEITGYTGPTELIVFQENLTPGILRNLFKKYVH